MSRMAPANSSRQLWMWSLPSLVVLLSLVWYKRKRNTLRSDPGGTLKDLPETIEGKLEEDKEESLLPLSESVDEQDSSSSPCVHVNAVAVKNTGETEFCSEITEPLQTSEVIPDKSTLSCSLESAVATGEEVICKQAAVLNCEKGPKTELKDIVEVAKEAVLSFTESKEVQVESLEAAALMNCETEAISTSGKMKDTKDPVEVPVACPINAKDSDDKVASLEGKLASLALGSSEEQRRGAERDSANHSPVDVMLASPSMSSYSDEHSEGSSDSGKGCSDVASPPSRTPVGSGSLAGDADVDTGVDSTSSYSVYDFLLPQQFVGRLIGRHGTFVHDIKSKTNATIWIKKHPETTKHKICSVEGTPTDIDNALALIRERFPSRKYPNVTLEQVSLVPTTFPLVPDFCQLHLVEGVNNEVMISSLVTPAHMFVQQPYHPSYQYLQRLNHMMNSVYAQLETPNLPDPIEAGNICVAPAIDGWYRAQVVSSNEESQSSEIKFVDYGGYMTVNNPVLRQIRQDFMTLPFQATECYLANIKPTGESGEWSLDALRIVEELTRGQMLLAQVYDYASDGVPLIYLYSSINSQVVLINQELVARGMADLDDSVISSPTSEAGSLVVAAKAMAVAAAAGDSSSATSTSDSPTSNSIANNAESVKTVESSSSEEASN